MALGFGYLFLVCAGTGAMSTFCIVAFAAVFVAIAHTIFTWKRLYRCPSCEAPVKDHANRVPLDPEACPNCGARLK